MSRNISGCGFSHRGTIISAALAMMTSRSMAGAAPRSTIFYVSTKTFPARTQSGWNAITARPGISSRLPVPSSTIIRAASARRCTPMMRRVISSRCVASGMARPRADLLVMISKHGARMAANTRIAPCWCVPPGRCAYLKSASSCWASPIASSGVHVFSNEQRSATPWPISA